MSCSAVAVGAARTSARFRSPVPPGPRGGSGERQRRGPLPSRPTQPRLTFYEPSSNSSSPASSITGTPSFSAFASFEPGEAPATT